MAKYKITGLPKKQYAEGGFIELDIPNDAIQDYVNKGYIVEEVPQYPIGGIFKGRKKYHDYTPWSGVNPEIVQPGEDPFALPTNTPTPAPLVSISDYENMFPGWSQDEIDSYYTEKEAYDAKLAKRAKYEAYVPEELVYKDLARPKATFMLAEDMPADFLKKLKDLGFYANKTASGDYEIFSNKDIADLIYAKGITPTELATEFKLGTAGTLKTYFEPVYTNASMIHAKRNTQKIDKLIDNGYTKEQAINKLVKQGEGTKSGLTKLYGTYTDAAYNKNKAEVDALTSMGIKDIDKLSDYQKQMYLTIQNAADTDYQKNVQSAVDDVASWDKWGIQPAESTAVRNNLYGDNTTAWEENENDKFLAQQALDRYNATTAQQTNLGKRIIGSENLTDEERKNFLENPDEFGKLYQDYINWYNAPQGEEPVTWGLNDPYVRVTPGQLKSDFNITPQGAKWTAGRDTERRTIDGPVQMLYPERYVIGPGGGLVGTGFKAANALLEFPLVSLLGSKAAPWLTAGNALTGYFGYETVKPGGLISESIEGFKEGDQFKGWSNAGMSALNLLPFVGPTVKGLNYLDDVARIENTGDITQAGFGDWLKPISNKSTTIDDVTLKNLKANNYQGASDDVLTKIIEKQKAEAQKGWWTSTMTPDESLILKANKDRVDFLYPTIEVAETVKAAPKTGFLGKTYDKSKGLVTGAGTKSAEYLKNFGVGYWDRVKEASKNTYGLTVGSSAKATKTAVQNTTKYQSMDEIAQSMYGSKFEELSGLAKTQVEKTFKAQPLPSGASTSGQGVASTMTSVSDDVLLKNKIAQQKYGEDYDKVSSWAQSAVDKEFQAAKTLQQEATASAQATTNAAENTGGTWGDWIDRDGAAMGLGITGTVGALGDDENSNLMLASLPLAFMSRGKLNLSPDKLKYLKLATGAANEITPLKAASVLDADASNIVSFFDGPAFNLSADAAKETQGAFNQGVFNIKNEPNFIAKIENADAVGSARGMPEYSNINMAEAMQNISGPTFGKVHRQIESTKVPGRRSLILNKVEGTPYDQLIMDDFLNLSDDAIVGFHDDLQTLKRNNLGFDFTGNNYMLDRNTGQFKLFDIDPHTTTYDPNKMTTFDFFQNQVYGGGNPLLYGSKQAGYNLQDAMRQRLLRDVELKMGQAGVSDTDIMGIKNVYDQRLKYLLKGLNYEKDGGSVEIDIDPEMLNELLANGYNVEQM